MIVGAKEIQLCADIARVRAEQGKPQDAKVFEYKGALYPSYLKHGNAMRHIMGTAAMFCEGRGLDVGAGKWPLPWAEPVELTEGGSAEALPEGKFDFIFSSHCLEHLANPISVLEHWKTRLKPGGTMFLYLPSHEMIYWHPRTCRKHLHTFRPDEMAETLRSLGFVNVMHSERDLYWSFAVVGFAPEE